MKRISAAVIVLAVSACAFLLSVHSSAQQAPSPGSVAMSQDQSVPAQANPNDPNESKSFTGKIMKAGDKLVLTDAMGKKTYQLDDQTKAKEFLNKNVKVTGTVDSSTGTIRVTAIDPV